MTMNAWDAYDAVASVFRAESSRVLATLIRLLGDFDAAEEAMQDAFAAAVEQWAEDGVPTRPRAWLVSVGRHHARRAYQRALALATLEPERRFLERRIHMCSNSLSMSSSSIST